MIVQTDSKRQKVMRKTLGGARKNVFLGITNVEKGIAQGTKAYANENASPTETVVFVI